MTLQNKIESEIFPQLFFPSVAYMGAKPEFLEDALSASNDVLKEIKEKFPQPNEIYPIYQSDTLIEHPKILELSRYILEAGTHILKSQGYYMDPFLLGFQELWCQEHYKYSGMEQHTHGSMAQLVGFYFLETPENCSNIVLHDPRPAKVQINLPESDMSQVTTASSMINFTPEAGMLFFTNAWLPHSFTRNASDKSMKFIHFTLGIAHDPDFKPNQCNTPEVV